MMHLILRRLMKVTHTSWFNIGLVALVLLFLGLYVLPEAETRGGNQVFDGWFDRVYFLIVTMSTVGYGDLSPQTIVGRCTVILIILLGVGIAASVISQVSDIVMKGRRKEMNGLSTYKNMVDHLVILGYHDRKTKFIIDEIIADSEWESNNIIVVDNNLETNPFEHMGVKFIRGDLHSDDTLERCGAVNAKKILIDGDEDGDGETILTAIAVNSIPCCSADVVAYVVDPQNAKHLIRLNRKIRVIVSMEANLMVQEIQDPGVVKIMHEMLSNTEGNTIYKIEIPTFDCHIGSWNFKDVSEFMKAKYNATVLAIETGSHMLVNPSNSQVVVPGHSMFVVCSERPTIGWEQWDELSEKQEQVQIAI